MKLENFPPRNRDAQTKEIGNLKNLLKITITHLNHPNQEDCIKI